MGTSPMNQTGLAYQILQVEPANTASISWRNALQIAACSAASAALYWVMESAPSIVDAAGFVFDFGMA
jgi:hypothetical protein